MGGIFGGAPEVPSYTPPPPPPPLPVVPTVNPEDEARKQREEAMARNRRGRAGMVATSERGVLSQAPVTTKSLLGE